MVTIKVFDCKGIRELKCFSTITDVPYIDIESPEDLLPDFDLSESEE